jgi:hypothetical protein
MNSTSITSNGGLLLIHCPRKTIPETADAIHLHRDLALFDDVRRNGPYPPAEHTLLLRQAMRDLICRLKLLRPEGHGQQLLECHNR